MNGKKFKNFIIIFIVVFALYLLFFSINKLNYAVRVSKFIGVIKNEFK